MNMLHVNCITKNQNKFTKMSKKEKNRMKKLLAIVLALVIALP
jgi:hypothetical protein